MPGKYVLSQAFAPLTTRWTAKSWAVPEKLRAEQGPGMILGSSRRRPSRSTMGAASASMAAARRPSDDKCFQTQATRRHCTIVHRRVAGLSGSASPSQRPDLTSQPQKWQPSTKESESLLSYRSPTVLRGEKRLTSFCFTLKIQAKTSGSQWTCSAA